MTDKRPRIQKEELTDDRSKGLLKNKSFWVRTISGLIMTAILVTVFVVGGYVMWGFLLLLSLLGQYEFYKALKLYWGVFAWVGYLATIAYYIVLLIFGSIEYTLLIFAILLVADLAVFVLTYPRYSLEQTFAGFFSVFYVGVALSFLFIVRIHPPSGAYLVWLVVLSSWGCDIFAYLVGMLFGKHPFVPKLSPKKSVEGAIGGVVGAIVLGVVYGLIVQKYIPDVPHAPLIFGIICMFAAAAGQVGDLAASAIKRKVGIKDYSKLIPGHGGILDRFDSVIMVAPIIFLITIYMNIVN